MDVQLSLTVMDDESGDNSVAALTSTNLEKIACLPGSNCVIFGHKMHKTFAILSSTTQCDDTQILISDAIRRNLKVMVGDLVRVKRITLPAGKRILLLPNEDTTMGSSRTFESELKNYFISFRRPVRKGDIFSVKSDIRAVEFQVMQTDPLRGCYVAASTKVECAEPGKLPDAGSIGFADIGGLEKEIAILKVKVINPIYHPEVHATIGVKPSKGVLFYGVPGTGKTLLAKALAYESNAYFHVINGPEILVKQMGESEANIREAFEICEKYAPSILFIDEIDSIAPNRDKGSETSSRVVSQLLTLMDGIEAGAQNVFVIGATNRVNSIDPALRRGGRFAIEVNVSVPNKAARLAILKLHTRKMNLHRDVDLEQIAAKIHGFVGADIVELCTQAAELQIQAHQAEIDATPADEYMDTDILAEMQVTQDNFLGAMRGIKPSLLREHSFEKPTTTWDETGGLSVVKNALRELVLFPMRHPEKYTKFAVKPARGLLLFGPPGCGKTMAARAIAHECDANFIQIKSSDVLNKWFGESEKRLSDMFSLARSVAPVIVFMDELDALTVKRGITMSDTGGVADRVVNQLLQEIEGIGSDSLVFVIGATNRPEIIDEAFLRPGRLDKLVYIGLPDDAGRDAIFKAKLRISPLESDVNFEDMVAQTKGFSGADICGACDSAGMLAMKESVDLEKEEEERKRKGETAVIAPDPVQKIGKKHFDQALQGTARSVTEKMVEQYTNFIKQRRAMVANPL